MRGTVITQGLGAYISSREVANMSSGVSDTCSSARGNRKAKRHKMSDVGSGSCG